MGVTIDRYHQYYADGGDHGSYRQISLQEIIDSFNATYVGEGKICEKVTLNDVTFHAIRGLQELSYDTLRSAKDWEIVVPSTLVMVMPVDYVNYIKVSWSDGNGIERVLYPETKSSNPRDINTAMTDFGAFAALGDDTDLASDEESAMWDSYKSQSVSDMGSVDADDMDDEYGRLVGGRYGLNAQFAQANGSFYIDEDAGRFHFSSNLAGKTLVLKYLSDGIISTSAVNSTIQLNNSYVPKLAEEAIYAHILYGVLFARKDTPAGLLSEIKRRRFAETRKAKLRLSNIKIEELTQVFRGSYKIIKH